MRKSLVVVGLAIASIAFVLSACSSPSTSPTGTTGGSGTTIVEKNIAFNPTTLSVAVGATVTFENQDTVAHHVVVGTTDLGLQQPGQTVTWKAPSDGVYLFHCLIHPQMTGQITVGAGGNTVGTLPGSGTGTGY